MGLPNYFCLSTRASLVLLTSWLLVLQVNNLLTKLAENGVLTPRGRAMRYVVGVLAWIVWPSGVWANGCVQDPPSLPYRIEAAKAEPEKRQVAVERLSEAQLKTALDRLNRSIATRIANAPPEVVYYRFAFASPGFGLAALANSRSPRQHATSTDRMSRDCG